MVTWGYDRRVKSKYRFVEAFFVATLMGVFADVFAELPGLNSFGFVQNERGELHKNTLIRVISANEKEIKLQIFKQTNENWVSLRKVSLPPSQWSELAVKNASLTTDDFVAIQRRNGKFYSVLVDSRPLVCKPRNELEDFKRQTTNIVSFANTHSSPIKAPDEAAPKHPSSNTADPELQEIYDAMDWAESWSWSSSLDRSMKTVPTLATAKREFLLGLQKKVNSGDISQAAAVQLLSAVTLFGEFRGVKNPSSKFWMLKILDERVRQYDVRNTRIFLDDTSGEGGKAIDWLKGTRAGAALAKNQFSSWKVMADNNTLRAMLNPSREKTAGRAAYRSMAKFIVDFDKSRYKILGKDPQVTLYDSPTAYFDMNSLQNMGYENTSNAMREHAPHINSMIRMPKIKDTMTGEIYEDWMTLIGGR